MNKLLKHSLLVCAVFGLALLLAGPGYCWMGWRHPNDSPGPPCGCADPCPGGGGGGGGDACGRPIIAVNHFTGDLTISDKPLYYQGAGGDLPFRMHYSTQSDQSSTLGARWGHTFSTRIISDMPYGVRLIKPNLNDFYFPYDAGSGAFSAIVGKACKVSGTTDGEGNPDGYSMEVGYLGTIAPEVQTLPSSQQQSYANPQPPGKVKFDLSGQLQKITSPDGLIWTIAYSSGRVTTVSDPKGRQTTFTYNASGRLTRVDIPGGFHADFTYDAYNRLSTVTDAVGDTYTYGYSGTDTKIASLTEPDGRQLQFTYTTFKNKPAIASIAIAGLSSSTVTYEYLPQTNGQLYVDVTQTKDGQDRVTRYIYENTDDEANGRYYGTLLALVQDQGDSSHLNATQAWAYNSYGKVIKYRDSYQTETGGKEHRSWFYYEDANLPMHLTKMIDAENADANPPTSSCPAYRFFYDSSDPNSGSFGNLIKITTPQGRELDITYATGTHRPTAITLVDQNISGQTYNHTTNLSWYGSGTGYLLQSITDAEGNTTSFSYDANKWYLATIDPPFGNNITLGTNDVGDITSITDGNGNTTSFQWDGIHRLTQITYPSIGAGAKSVLLDWMCCGLEQVTDENGIVTKAEYDPYTHWLKKLTEDYGAGHLNYVTEYTYDEVGNTKTVKNARGKTTSYTYDGADRVTRADYPDGTYETWQYRDDGRVWKHTDALGRTITYRYDADDRLAGSGSYKAIDYPNNTDIQITRGDLDGLVTSFVDASGTNTATYYPSGWLKTYTNGAGKTVTYQYNDVGAISTLTTPGSLNFTYTYNPLNLLSTVTNPNSVSMSYTYDSGGRVSRITRPGSYIDFQYNARNWVTAVLNRTTGGTTRYDANYYYQDGTLWDHTGNPLKRVENIAGSTYNTTFRYDNVYRVTEETKRDSGNNVLYTLGYTYDSVGNRLSRTLGGVSTTYTYDDNDKLLNVNGSQSCWYDLNGNLTSTGVNLPTQSFAYDDENQLTSLTSGGVTNLFYYNALGQRYRARLNGTYWRYVYNGDRVLEETNDSGTVQSRYTTASPSYFSPLLHMWRTTSTSRFPSYDLTGSARQLLDASGIVTDTYELDAFGRTVSSTGSTPNPYKYNAAWGYITDSSGFQQLGARFYWPEVGRFLQQDPIRYGRNWYSYVRNNPVRRTDPTGLRDLYFPFEVEFGIGLVAELGGGLVIDFDDPWQSGIYGTMGAGWGLTYGAGAGVGYAPRDIEGGALNGDANLGLPVSVSASWDAQGWNGGAFLWGPGLGASETVSVSGTLTAADIACAARKLLGAIKGWFD